MRTIPFVDEDWTGYNHATIKSMILQEYEEQQCKKEGHRWVPSYYCSVCGLQASEALAEMTRKLKRRKGRGKTIDR